MQKLGQNFLKDSRALERIASAANITDKDTIIEIGPGHGELTRQILTQSPNQLLAIEKDEFLIKKFIQPLCDQNKNLKILPGDALRLLPEAIEHITSKTPSTYKLVGNIPYYITGHLMRLLGELKTKPELIVLTIQKEVAERMCAVPPKTSVLSASVQFWGTPEIVRYISRKSFKPAPRVDSAIIKITPLKEKTPEKQEKDFYKTLHILFLHPRKTVLNNLYGGSALSREEAQKLLESLGIDPKLRPQNLNIETINKISLNLHAKKL